jgi:hypothetical protein
MIPPIGPGGKPLGVGISSLPSVDCACSSNDQAQRRRSQALQWQYWWTFGHQPPPAPLAYCYLEREPWPRRPTLFPAAPAILVPRRLPRRVRPCSLDELEPPLRPIFQIWHTSPDSAVPSARCFRNLRAHTSGFPQPRIISLSADGRKVSRAVMVTRTAHTIRRSPDRKRAQQHRGYDQFCQNVVAQVCFPFAFSPISTSRPPKATARVRPWLP